MHLISGSGSLLTGRFRLDHVHVHISGIDNIVLVQNRMLGGGTAEPQATFVTLDEYAWSCTGVSIWLLSFQTLIREEGLFTNLERRIYRFDCPCLAKGSQGLSLHLRVR
jgi:hypothetical protein